VTAEVAHPGTLLGDGLPLHRCAVLGSPIAHSLSPVLHEAAYAELGLRGWVYGRAEVSAGGLASFVDGLDDTWRGLSLTMPLKVEVLELDGVQAVSEAARLTGVANTLLLDGTRREVHNTDVAGLVWALSRALDGRVGTATLLGSGATARSALVALAELGAVRVQVLARDPAKAHALRPLAETVGLELVVLPWGTSAPDVDVLVSTVTAGAVDGWVDEIAGSADVVLDVVYDPWPTTLATTAARTGAAVLDGLDLLVGQAVLQVELMTGLRPSPDVLRAAGDAALAER
jgi:shikimate dehydrogenase